MFVSGSLYGQQGPNVGGIHGQHTHFPFPATLPAIEKERQHNLELERQHQQQQYAVTHPALEAEAG